MTTLWYMLDEEKNVMPIPEQHNYELIEMLMSEQYRRVAKTQVLGYWVSTVFLALDHAFAPNQPPVVFETMIFPIGEPREVYANRYHTWDEAVEGHWRAVRWLVPRIPWLYLQEVKRWVKACLQSQSE